MKFFTKQTSIFALLTALFCAVAVFAAAANYQLFGDAELKPSGKSSPTAAQIRSSATVAPNYGGIDFTVPDGLTVADLDTLSTDYKFLAGNCAAGSPRFQVNVTNGTDSGSIWVYLGPGGDYNNCGATDWTSTGNLIDPADLVETTQLNGGAYQQSWANVQTAYGSYDVTGIQLVVDSYYAVSGGVQTMLADNVQINLSTTTFESANSCKNGGWQAFDSAPGPFPNQGQCVSYFAKGGK